MRVDFTVSPIFVKSRCSRWPMQRSQNEECTSWSPLCRELGCSCVGTGKLFKIAGWSISTGRKRELFPLFPGVQSVLTDKSRNSRRRWEEFMFNNLVFSSPHDWGLQGNFLLWHWLQRLIGSWGSILHWNQNHKIKLQYLPSPFRFTTLSALIPAPAACSTRRISRRRLGIYQRHLTNKLGRFLGWGNSKKARINRGWGVGKTFGNVGFDGRLIMFLCGVKGNGHGILLWNVMTFIKAISFEGPWNRCNQTFNKCRSEPKLNLSRSLKVCKIHHSHLPMEALGWIRLRHCFRQSRYHFEIQTRMDCRSSISERLSKNLFFKGIFI